MTAVIRRLWAALFLAFVLGLFVGGAPAQTADPAASGGDLAAESSLDYDVWAAMANRAEGAIEARATPGATLEQFRGQLVDWRAAFTVAQSTNSARIGSLRSQIAALGAAPADGITEPAEIVARRTELSDQLVRLQAPGIAADEAYSRADGLIREIDLRLRALQADELLRLWPAPINPANWPAGLRTLSSVAVGAVFRNRGSVAKSGRAQTAGGQLSADSVVPGVFWRAFMAWAGVDRENIPANANERFCQWAQGLGADRVFGSDCHSDHRRYGAGKGAFADRHAGPAWR